MKPVILRTMKQNPGSLLIFKSHRYLLLLQLTQLYPFPMIGFSNMTKYFEASEIPCFYSSLSLYTSVDGLRWTLLDTEFTGGKAPLNDQQTQFLKLTYDNDACENQFKICEIEFSCQPSNIFSFRLTKFSSQRRDETLSLLGASEKRGSELFRSFCNLEDLWKTDHRSNL